MVNPFGVLAIGALVGMFSDKAAQKLAEIFNVVFQSPSTRTDGLAGNVPLISKVDPATIALLKKRGICLCPTLTREVSAYIYESRPAFFDDPFFLKEAERPILDQLLDPKKQEAMHNSAAAQRYKVALETASRNLKKLEDAGVTIAFGTDTAGAPPPLSPCSGTTCGLGSRTMESGFIDSSLDGGPRRKRQRRPSRAATEWK